MSETMRLYLQSYMNWISEGAPQGVPFKRQSGLCGNVASWLCSQKGGLRAEYLRVEIVELRSELKRMLVADSLTPGYPFGGALVYWGESNSQSAYMNEDRLSWIRGKLND